MPSLDINNQRLHQQQLTEHRFSSAGEVVVWMGAIQAQDYAGAKWALGLRLPGGTDADIEQAIASKTIVRTWLMRGTLQIVAAADLRWMLALLAPRILSGGLRRRQQLELDAHTLSRSNDVITAALRDGQQLDRKQLLALLQRNGISTEAQRAPHLLQYAAVCGIAVQVGMRRNQPIYMLLDDVVAPAPTLARDEALAKLARIYFNSRGPATLPDYTWWSGLTAAEARVGLALAQPHLARDRVGNQDYWLSNAPGKPGKPSPHALLLPAFDEYLIAYQDREAALAPEVSWMIQLGNGLRRTIAWDGMIVGTWSRNIRNGAVEVDCKFFDESIARDQQTISGAIQCYRQFVFTPA